VKYLLDTNVCVDYLNGRYPRVTRQIQESSPNDLCVSSVAVAELRYGAEKSVQRQRNHERLGVFLAEIRCVDCDTDAASISGPIRGNAERDGGAGDQAVERVTKRRKGPRLDHVPSLQGQEEKCRITLDRVAPFVKRGSQADPPAFLELSHLEKADRGHGNPDPTRFGTTDEATGLSAESLLNAAQVEDQRRRIENGTGLTHGVDGESAPNER